MSFVAMNGSGRRSCFVKQTLPEGLTGAHAVAAGRQLQAHQRPTSASSDSQSSSNRRGPAMPTLALPTRVFGADPAPTPRLVSPAIQQQQPIIMANNSMNGLRFPTGAAQVGGAGNNPMNIMPPSTSTNSVSSMGTMSPSRDDFYDSEDDDETFRKRRRTML